MAGRMEVGFPRERPVNLKHQVVLTTLRNVRALGHPYVDVREDGKKLIFFCTLCLAPCHSDSILFSHLNGKNHTESVTSARITLLKPNPWPFADGVIFFHCHPEEGNRGLPALDSEQVKLQDAHHVDEGNLAIVSYQNLGANASSDASQEIGDHSNGDGKNTGGLNLDVLVIPAVLQKDVVSDLTVKHMGVGRIGGRFREKDNISDGIHRLWCEWLGNKNMVTEGIDVVPEHDFAVVTFAYNYEMGRKGLLDGFRHLLSSSLSEAEDNGSSRAKKRKAFSEPDNFAAQNEFAEEESPSSNSSNMKLVLSVGNDQQVLKRILSSKTMRKQLRGQEHVASERACAICLQKMLPDKDVAALLNRKTGKLVCSSRNSTGAFHVFHASCLIQWILLCEVEIFENQSVSPNTKRRCRRKAKVTAGEDVTNEKLQVTKKKIDSALCPECQGTGITLDGDEHEIPSVPLSEIFNGKIKLLDAHKAWVKSPEVLDHCSIGFRFPPQSDEVYQENVTSLKLLHFFRAEDES